MDSKQRENLRIRPDQNVEMPRFLEDFALGTQSIDLNRLTYPDVTSSGSFDIRGMQFAFLGKFLDALPIPALLVNRSLFVVHWNKACHRISLAEDDAPNRPLSDIFVHSREAKRAGAAVKKVFQDRRQQQLEAILGTRENSTWGRLHIRSLRMGEERSVLVMVEDLTLEKKQVLITRKHSAELRKAHENLEIRVKERTAELAEANHNLRVEMEERQFTQERLNLAANVIASSNEAILITDASAKIVDVNEAFSRVTGFSKDEVMGENPRFMNSGWHDKKFWEDVWKIVAAESHWRGEIWDRRKNGEIYPKILSISSIFNEKGEVTNYIGIFSDITREKLTEQRLERLAHYDPLTGLPNRVLFRDRLKQAISTARRSGAKVAILFLDLDGFKMINDTLGHPAGDQLLVAVGRRLSESMLKSDTVARLGGDEFTLMMVEFEDIPEVSRLAQKVLGICRRPFSVSGRKVFITASIGLALYPNDGTDVDRLLQHADTAMYSAKRRGKNRFQYFSQDMNAKAVQRLNLETALREALNQDEFQVYYQPRVDIASDTLVGCEALVRWKHPHLGMVPPNEFIPVAEAAGMIEKIGEWVLIQACRQIKDWISETNKGLVVSVNLSSHQIRGQETVDRIGGILKEIGLPSSCLELEVTESALMRDIEEGVRTLTSLRSLGIPLSLDDFGTGYSSLSYLKRFPVQKLKIDRSFIKDVTVDPDDESIVKTIIAIGHSLRMKVVAEGVETKEQTDFLRENGCDEVQGFYFGRPLPPDVFHQFMLKRIPSRIARTK